ncbi:MAG: hypothetical protein KJ717_07305, partial [Proteobacteria bacterium]|nr:hypothetical protein [Pseudomonadota bacterium]
MFLLFLNTIFISLLAIALTLVTRPRTLSAWLASFIAFFMALIVLMSETVGRIIYTPASMTISSGLLSIMGGGVLWSCRSRLRRYPFQTYLKRRLQVLFAHWSSCFAFAAWVVIFFYSLIAVAILPPSVPDVLRYHLPMVVGWFQAGKVSIDPLLDYRANFFPHNIELLNGFSFILLKNDQLVCLPQVIISGIFWPLVAYMAMCLCGIRRRWRLFGALLASMNAPVVLQMRSEMIDIGFYSVFLLALIAAIGRERFYGKPWLIFGVSAGLALGSKGPGLLAVFVCFIIYCISFFWHAKWKLTSSRSKSLIAEVSGAVVLVVSIGCWVLGYNLITYHNPLYPFALKIGPFVLPSPDETYSIFYNAWLKDFGISPFERLIGG